MSSVFAAAAGKFPGPRATLPTVRTIEPGAGRHVAVFSFPAYAHIAPGLPVVRELVRRGHRVSYLVADRFAEQVAAAGAEVVPYPSSFPWASAPAPAGDPDSRVRMMLHFFTEGLAPLSAAARRFADDRPDLLVHDLAASEAARTLARHWDRPVVQFCPTIASGEPFSMNARQNEEGGEPDPEPIPPGHPLIAAFLDRRAAMLDDLGLAGVTIDGFGGDDGPNVVFLPREFQPAGELFDDRFSFVGPCPDPALDGPDWTPPPGGRPVLLGSVGTSHSDDQVEFLRRCVRAFAGSRWQVVLTLGHRVRPDELGPLPGNVEAHQWMPHPRVLRHASVFLTHAGMGSVMEACWYGVPMVAAPYHVDQRVIGRRIAALGLGRFVERASCSDAGLLAAVEAVAADPSAQARARWMREIVRTAGGAPRAADFLESLLDLSEGTARP